jgi:RHS repeat-associated protein
MLSEQSAGNLAVFTDRAFASMVAAPATAGPNDWRLKWYPTWYLCAFFHAVLLFFLIFAIRTPELQAATKVDFGELRAASSSIEAIGLLDNDSFSIPPGANGQLTAETYPTELEGSIRWSVTDQNGDLDFVLDGKTGYITVSDNSGTGWVRVQAEADGCQPQNLRIEIGCADCAAESRACSLVAGAGNIANGSIDVRISLGRTREGRWAGDLFLFAEAPSVKLSTPEALSINSSSGQVVPLYRDAILEQIITPQALVAFARFSPLEYEIYYYDFAQRGIRLEDGLYSIEASALPMAVWRIQNPDESGKTHDQLSVTEIRGEKARDFLYVYAASEKGWTLISNNGQKIDEKTERTNSDGDRVARRLIFGADGVPATVTETVYHRFDFGEKRIREIVDPDGLRLITTYRYVTAEGPGYGKLEARLDPDGGWIRYQYDPEGRITREVRPYLDAAIDSPNSQCVVVARSYAAVSRADSRDVRDNHRPRLVVETTAGIETARTYHAYIREKDGGRIEITERCTRLGKPFGDSTNLRQAVSYYGTIDKSPEAGKIKSRLAPDGRLTTYSYDNGQFQLSPDPANCVFIQGEGEAQRTTITYGTLEHPEGLVLRTTRETTIVDAWGQEKMQETFVRTEKGFTRIDWRFNSHNRQGQIIETLYANHTRTDSEWGCCGKTSETDSNGITYRYVYDDLKRVVAKTNEATGVTTQYTYDAAGRRLTVTLQNGDLSAVHKNRYDGAGRLAERVDPAGLITRFSDDQTVSKIIRPGGAAEITTRHADGRVRSVTGTAVVPRFYRYGVNADGTQWTRMAIGTQDSVRWEKTTRDFAGRVIRVEKPGYVGIETIRKVYDLEGRLVRTETPARAAVLYAYDQLGNITRVGLDVDGDGKLSSASMDRIASVTTSYQNIDAAWWQVVTRSIFAHDNNADETIVSVQRQRLSGWQNQVVSEGIAIDIHGNETRSVTSLNRPGRTLTHVVSVPEAVIPIQAVYKDGRLAATVGKAGIARQYGYDPLGRRIAVEDAREGISIVHYDAGGRVDYIEDAAGNRTRYSYDPATGQMIAQYNALGKATRYAYDLRGQLVRTWGDVPYPVAYAYDDFGQMFAMSTFRDGIGWSGSFWPVNTGQPDQTHWQYDQATGLLQAKVDARGNRTSYDYRPGGMLAARTWARTESGRPIETFYHYDSATGELRRIDYSDDTPDIAFTYDRLGRKVRINDAAGVHTFNYDDNLQLVRESLTGHQIYGINHRYDKLGRTSGFDLDDGYDVSYTYDPNGRFDKVAWRVGGQAGDVSYRYLEDSNRLAGMEGENGLVVTYSYETHRAVKTAVVNRFQDRLLSRYEYQYDRLGRRINAKHSGKAFARAGFSFYAYNDRNELETASRFAGNTLSDQTEPLPEQERIYQYDPIGNRIEAVEGERPTRFESNSRNQNEAVFNASQRIDRLAYDADGNLIEDGGFDYSWDAENRLAAVIAKKANPGSRRLEFQYDYAGRRTIKKVFRFEQSGYKLENEIHFIYNGWNLVRQVNTSGIDKPSVKSYVWGLDVSQSLQGAGGVGGLIASVEGSLTYNFLYDVNGNVRQVISGSAGKVAAQYDYDPFGRAVHTAESIAVHFRFATKYFDTELNLYHFGYRYYSPKRGRWINKDPIGEAGGLNLYSYVANDPLNNVDPLGLFDWCECGREALTGMKAAARDLGTELQDLFSSNPFAAAVETYAAVKKLIDEVRNDNLGALAEAFFPDIYTLSAQWDQLEEKRCFYVGKIAAEYGVSAAIGAGAAKVVSILKKLKLSNRNIRLLSVQERELIVSKSVRHGPMNPGPLSDDIVNTFRSGSYTAMTLNESTTLYRVISDAGNPTGSFWTRIKPEGPMQSVIDSALDQNWGNTATKIIEAKVPAGTKIYEGAAAAQRGLVGGGNQVYVPKVNPKWVVP